MAKTTHFEDKDAIGHVAEVQARGILTSAEIHGTETPGHINAGADSAREMAIAIILIEAILSAFHAPLTTNVLVLLIFAFGYTVWKIGRSAWFGWFRLERLHRVLKQEKWEIEHHRDQEREELTVLYRAKGFDGKLLEDVVDVLMADSDRLLRVMVEEELGLSLEKQEHPLKQGFGAGIGCLCACILCFFGYILFPAYGLVVSSLAVIGFSSGLLAFYAKNDITSAIVWNLGIAILAYGCTFFTLQYLYPSGLS